MRIAPPVPDADWTVFPKMWTDAVCPAVRCRSKPLRECPPLLAARCCAPSPPACLPWRTRMLPVCLPQPALPWRAPLPTACPPSLAASMLLSFPPEVLRSADVFLPRTALPAPCFPQKPLFPQAHRQYCRPAFLPDQQARGRPPTRQMPASFSLWAPPADFPVLVNSAGFPPQPTPTEPPLSFRVRNAAARAATTCPDRQRRHPAASCPCGPAIHRPQARHAPQCPRR